MRCNLAPGNRVGRGSVAVGVVKRSGSYGWLVAAAVVCAALAAAPVADARIVRATSILPPGESGFVTVGGLLTGTGSPHLYDQQQPFIDFQRKSAMFNQPVSTITRIPQL
jgi:hypothetical protein